MGTFNPEQFLDATITEANSTQMLPVPEGDYTGIVLEDPKFREIQGKKDPSKTYRMMDLVWTLEDPALAEKLGRNQVNVRQSVMLDFTDNGSLDMGKGRNIALGRLREALGLNNPGQAFSFRQISGKVAKVHVKHRVTDDGRVFDEVDAVARA